jgi:hypothetical protein
MVLFLGGYYLGSIRTQIWPSSAHSVLATPRHRVVGTDVAALGQGTPWDLQGEAHSLLRVSYDPAPPPHSRHRPSHSGPPFLAVSASDRFFSRPSGTTTSFDSS